MGVLPTKIIERLQWFEQRESLWTANAAQIGLQPAQVTQLSGFIATARTKYDEAQTARAASEMSTFMMKEAVRDMSVFGSDLIKTIKAFAETTGNKNVYALASVPPPAPPSPAGPPEAPTDIVGDPNADGTVTVRWRGSLRSQTFFTVWRKIGSAGSFVQIGAVAAKAFIDTGVPQGVASVSYIIRAQRNNLVSQPSTEAVVNFGSGGNQGVNALRMAA
jgi:hypothetical protein